mmetsp:Transcript_1078/g.2453  ORF Transcript_1078/g.2453 Transcript_1078/m.2453 type:complete len:261 (-) Transcript_1078:83-865(-)
MRWIGHRSPGWCFRCCDCGGNGERRRRWRRRRHWKRRRDDEDGDDVEECGVRRNSEPIEWSDEFLREEEGRVRGRSSSEGLPVLDGITRGEARGKVSVAVGERYGCRMSVSRSTTICRVFPWYLRLPACRCSHHRHRHGTIDEEVSPSPCPHDIHVPLSSPSMEHSFHTRIRFLKESRSPMTFLLSYYPSSFSPSRENSSCDLRSRFHSNWSSNQDGRSRQYLVHQTLFLLSNCFADVLDSETLSRNLSVSPPSYYLSSS